MFVVRKNEINDMRKRDPISVLTQPPGRNEAFNQQRGVRVSRDEREHAIRWYPFCDGSRALF